MFNSSPLMLQQIRKKKTLAAAFDNAFCMCNNAGFRITHPHCDVEFECLENEMMDDDDSIKSCAMLHGNNMCQKLSGAFAPLRRELELSGIPCTLARQCQGQ